MLTIYVIVPITLFVSIYGLINPLLRKHKLDNEIKRLVTSQHLTDDFGALDQLIFNPEEYSVIIDIIGNQNTVSPTKTEIEQYMRPSKFIYLHVFELIIMSQSNIYI